MSPCFVMNFSVFFLFLFLFFFFSVIILEEQEKEEVSIFFPLWRDQVDWFQVTNQKVERNLLGMWVN